MSEDILARIYVPTKNAMQSGRYKKKPWVLEVSQAAISARSIEPLMGWTASSNTESQVVLRFASQDEAEAYAKRHEIAYEVDLPKERKITYQSYADNFK